MRAGARRRGVSFKAPQSLFLGLECLKDESRNRQQIMISLGEVQQFQHTGRLRKRGVRRHQLTQATAVDVRDSGEVQNH